MAEIGERVRVDFIGRLDDGAQFSNSYIAGSPLEVTIGAHEVLPAFERVLAEMEPGEERSLRIPAEQAYGAYDESLIETVPRASIPHADRLPIGQYVVFGSPAGDLRVKVLDVTEDSVVFDHNHELAGQDLSFEITLREVVRESAIDREMHPAGCACGCDRLKEALDRS
ncbi:MAG: peptidylprolyl isomerase [Coriobacteriales bacterium]